MVQQSTATRVHSCASGRRAGTAACAAGQCEILFITQYLSDRRTCDEAGSSRERRRLRVVGAAGARASRRARLLEGVRGLLITAHNDAERMIYSKAIEDYARGHVPLVVPLTLLRHHVRRHGGAPGVAWLADQTYLDPDPKELMLRNHV